MIHHLIPVNYTKKRRTEGGHYYGQLKKLCYSKSFINYTSEYLYWLKKKDRYFLFSLLHNFKGIKFCKGIHCIFCIQGTPSYSLTIGLNILIRECFVHDLEGITDGSNDYIAIDGTNNLEGIVDGRSDQDLIVGVNGYY
jgi:hypothetical protein